MEDYEKFDYSMKVIHFITGIDKTGGGTTAYMQLLSTELKQLVDLIVVTGISPHPVELKGVNVHFFNLSLVRWFRLEKEFSQLIESEKPDIVHINGIWQPQTWLFQKVAQNFELKVVVSPHGMLDPYILKRHPLKKKIAMLLFQKKAINSANYFVVTSNLEYENLRKIRIKQNVEIIPNAIDVQPVKQKTNYSVEGKKNILYLSRIHSQKGIELLIEAIDCLKNENIKLIIAGQGESSYVEFLNDIVVKKKLTRLIEFKGGIYDNEKWNLFNESDIFILPSYSECFGIVVAEALATGIPVITTTGTPWQELQTYNCGWWIDLNVENLTNSIIKALQLTPEDLKVMGARGRKLVEEKYEIKAVAKQMKEFYNRILNQL